jgi:hypothetical protein
MLETLLLKLTTCNDSSLYWPEIWLSTKIVTQSEKKNFNFVYSTTQSYMESIEGIVYFLFICSLLNDAFSVET